MDVSGYVRMYPTVGDCGFGGVGWWVVVGVGVLINVLTVKASGKTGNL